MTMRNGRSPCICCSPCEERESNCDSGFRSTSNHLLAMEHTDTFKIGFLDVQKIHFRPETPYYEEWPIAMHMSQSTWRERKQIVKLASNPKATVYSLRNTQTRWKKDRLGFWSIHFHLKTHDMRNGLSSYIFPIPCEEREANSGTGFQSTSNRLLDTEQGNTLKKEFPDIRSRHFHLETHDNDEWLSSRMCRNRCEERESKLWYRLWIQQQQFTH
jgi:hypothetical protein